MIWTKGIYQKYLDYLVSIGDEKLKEFNKRIINTKYEILGIKIPILKKIAKEIKKTDIYSFLSCVQDIYFEEVLISGLVGDSKYFYKYLDKIDNWALCDTFVSNNKYIKKDQDKYLEEYLDLLKSKKTYYIRVGLVTLLWYYIDPKYNDIILENLYPIKNKDYYVLMGMAWVLQKMSINDFGKVYMFLKEYQNPKLNKMVIGKIRDSYAFPKDKKEEFLKMLKKL